MSESVLIVYATKSGSTAEVADAVGGVLRAHRIRAEVCHVCDVRDVRGTTPS